MYTEDECKINGLQVVELSYDLNPSGLPVIQISYALTAADPSTKKVLHTHGKVTASGGNLSAPTWELLKQLLTSIEQDLIPRHFNTDKEKTNEQTGTTATRQEETPQF